MDRPELHDEVKLLMTGQLGNVVAVGRKYVTVRFSDGAELKTLISNVEVTRTSYGILCDYILKAGK
jgi:hypothetical protein